MKNIPLSVKHPLNVLVPVLAISVLGGPTIASAQTAAPPPAAIDDYEPGPDSKPQPGVPKGKTFSFPFEASRIYPGTVRNITVYVPAQYTGDKPACVYVCMWASTDSALASRSCSTI